MKLIKKLFLITIIISALFSISCEKMLDMKPENETLAEDALETTNDMQMLINSIYEAMSGGGMLGGAFQRYSDLMGDDVKPNDVTNKRTQIYDHNTSGYFTADDVFSNAYINILRANTVLESLDLINNLSAADRAQFEGEAKFFRALAHFCLVRMWAQPYHFTADNSHLGVVIKQNTKPELLPRNTVQEVYDFILADLLDAVNKVPAVNDIYVTSWSVKAVLADVYFNMHDYQNAFNYADDIVENGGFAMDTTSDSKFLFIDSLPLTTEGVFMFVTDYTYNSASGLGGYRSDNSDNPDLRIENSLYTEAVISSFGDERAAWYAQKNAGQSSEFAVLSKYDHDQHHMPVYHLTSIKFIRAEAAVNIGELAVAVEDVNDIIKRAYGDATLNIVDITDGAAAIMSAIRTQKRLELVGEGYRVYDLKRIGSDPGAYGESDLLIRGVPWDCPGLALQFPSTEVYEGMVLNDEGGC